jgi:BASS family bile acid:Na+ symporter
VRDALAGVLSIAVLMFSISSMLTVGLANDWRAVVAPLREVRKVLRVLAINFVLVPALAYAVLQIVPLERPLGVGLFLVATAAGAPFLVKLVQLAESDTTLATTMLVVLLPATVVYMPLVVPLALPEANVSAAAIATPLALTMLLPLAFGLAVRERFTRAALKLHPYVAKLSTLALLVLIAATVVVNMPGIAAMFGTFAILAALAVLGGAFLSGYLLGGPGKGSKEVLAFGTAQRNIAAATVVATQAVHDSDTLTMVVVTSLVTFALLFPMAAIFRRRTGRATVT